MTLDDIRVRAIDNSYPVDVLEDCETALVLFAAGFHGAQDGIFIADAGLTATCVDVRPERLNDMAAVYPSSWEFVVADAYVYAAECAAAPYKWDVLSIDCPSDAFDRCATMVDTWCDLARRAVILGSGPTTIVDPPYGWEVTDKRYRSGFRGGVYWTVIEKC